MNSLLKMKKMLMNEPVLKYLNSLKMVSQYTIVQLEAIGLQRRVPSLPSNNSCLCSPLKLLSQERESVDELLRFFLVKRHCMLD